MPTWTSIIRYFDLAAEVRERPRLEGAPAGKPIGVGLQYGAVTLGVAVQPVFEAGRHVGFTTSGARGPRTGLNLCFALIDTDPGETLDDSCARNFTVRIAGQDHAATPLRRPAFDPSHERMRA